MDVCIIFIIEGLAVLWDFKEKRIPNELIMAGFLSGAAWQWCNAQLAGLKSFLAGVFCVLLLLGIFHYFNMIGAGDIKLLMVSGGILGPDLCLKTILISFLIAAAFSVAVMFRYRCFKQRIHYFFQYFQDYFSTGKWVPYLQKEETVYLHLSLPVFLGSMLVAGGVL